MYDVIMRTTLAIDDDVLAAAKDLAALQRKSVGEIISALARRALQPPSSPRESRNGVPLLPRKSGSAPVSSELVRQLLEELP